MSVPICNRFHTRRDNTGTIMFFRGGTPLSRHSLRGTPSPRSTKFCHNKLESLGQPSEYAVILAYTVLIQIKSVTDGRIDRRPGHG